MLISVTDCCNSDSFTSLMKFDYEVKDQSDTFFYSMNKMTLPEKWQDGAKLIYKEL